MQSVNHSRVLHGKDGRVQKIVARLGPRVVDKQIQAEDSQKKSGNLL